MNIDKHIAATERKREIAYKRFIEPLDKEIEKYKNIKQSIETTQTGLNFTVEQQEVNLNRILGITNNENNV